MAAFANLLLVDIRRSKDANGSGFQFLRLLSLKVPPDFPGALRRAD
jgi:hypothetical protein